jgi:hypothetical protein
MRVAGVELKVALSGLAPRATGKPLLRISVPEGSFFTLTTLRSPRR